MKVLSANYLDRESSYPWLVRNTEFQEVGHGIVSKMVEATDVRFVPAPAGEQGFGCRVVGEIHGDVFQYGVDGDSDDTLPAVEETEPWVELLFDSWYGRFCFGTRNVENVSKLRLMPDGAMFAVLAS